MLREGRDKAFALFRLELETVEDDVDMVHLVIDGRRYTMLRERLDAMVERMRQLAEEADKPVQLP